MLQVLLANDVHHHQAAFRVRQPGGRGRRYNSRPDDSLDADVRSKHYKNGLYTPRNFENNSAHASQKSGGFRQESFREVRKRHQNAQEALQNQALASVIMDSGCSPCETPFDPTEPSVSAGNNQELVLCDDNDFDDPNDDATELIADGWDYIVNDDDNDSSPGFKKYNSFQNRQRKRTLRTGRPDRRPNRFKNRHQFRDHARLTALPKGATYRHPSLTQQGTPHYQDGPSYRSSDHSCSNCSCAQPDHSECIYMAQSNVPPQEPQADWETIYDMSVAAENAVDPPGPHVPPPDPSVTSNTSDTAEDTVPVTHPVTPTLHESNLKDSHPHTLSPIVETVTSDDTFYTVINPDAEELFTDQTPTPEEVAELLTAPPPQIDYSAAFVQPDTVESKTDANFDDDDDLQDEIDSLEDLAPDLAEELRQADAEFDRLHSEFSPELAHTLLPDRRTRQLDKHNAAICRRHVNHVGKRIQAAFAPSTPNPIHIQGALSAADATTRSLFTRYPATPLVQGVINDYNNIVDEAVTRLSVFKTPPPTARTCNNFTTARANNLHASSSPASSTNDPHVTFTVPNTMNTQYCQPVGTHADMDELSHAFSTTAPTVSDLTYLLSKQLRNIELDTLVKDPNLVARRKNFTTFIDDLSVVLSASEHTNGWLKNFPQQELPPLPPPVDTAIYNIIFAKVDATCKSHLRAIDCHLGSVALITLRKYFAQQNASVNTRIQRAYLLLRRWDDESATSFAGRFKAKIEEYHRTDMAPVDDLSQSRHFLEGMRQHPAYDVLVQSFKTEINQAE